VQISQDQAELKDLVRRFLSEKVTSEYVRERIRSGTRHDPEFLKGLGELGLDEGFAGDPPLFSFVELALVAEEAGRVVLPEPLVERLFGAYLVPRLLAPEDRARYSKVVFEKELVAYAPPACCELSTADSGVVSGEVLWGFGIEGASRLLAFSGSKDGRCAVVVDLLGQGVTRAQRASLDLTTALSGASLAGVAATTLSAEGSKVVEDCFEILKACEVFGACEHVIEMTLEYVKTREQFGVPIGSFQAIQHKLADIYAQAEALGALCRFAAWTVEHSPDQRGLTARAAVLQAATMGPQICEGALQCHGGIGFTWEYDLHLYLRRAKALEAAFGLTEGRADELLERGRG
jgi:alkylation response protein AidB-like acyl-CoA dehydrogenase